MKLKSSHENTIGQKLDYFLIYHFKHSYQPCVEVNTLILGSLISLKVKQLLLSQGSEQGNSWETPCNQLVSSTYSQLDPRELISGQSSKFYCTQIAGIDLF